MKMKPTTNVALPIQIFSSLQKFIEKRTQINESTKTIGFVPTMGFLHEGHLSLVRKAREENDIVIVSIFVNPAQFGPNEDLSRYPSNLPRDIAHLKKLGIDIMFTPDTTSMYPDGFITYVEPTGPLVTAAEGTNRPGHFRGMATIVLKLFQLIRPHNVYFGQKDAQQAAVVSHMIDDFNLPINLHIMPTIREEDGLAMSSRNAYLKPEERTAAGILYRALQNGRNVFDKNYENDGERVKQTIIETVLQEPLVKLEYVEIRHPESFVQQKTLKAPTLLLIAAKVGSTRLIDNFLLLKNGTWDTGIII